MKPSLKQPVRWFSRGRAYSLDLFVDILQFELEQFAPNDSLFE